MNQQINPTTGASSEPPVKRRRGRPRKDESQAQSMDKSSPALNRPPLRPMVTRMMQGEASSATKPTTTQIASKGKDHMEVDADQSADNDLNNDEMVGQVVTGVLESAFDAGYFLRVRVGDTDIHMRGVVFKEGSVVPVTPENDIAPNVKMHKRRDIPIPVMIPPQVARPPGDSLLKPTENSGDQQTQKLAVETVTQQECHTALPQGQVQHQQQEQQKVAVDQEQNTALKEPSIADEADEERETELSEPAEDGDQIEVREVGASNQPEDEVAVKSPPIAVGEPGDEQGSPRRDGVEESSEPLSKVQQTDQTLLNNSNEQSIDNIASGDVNSEKGVPETSDKADEVAASVLSKEPMVPPKPEFAGEDPVIMPTEVEPEIDGASGFQISMENTDTDEPDTMPEPPNAVSPMETE